MKLHYVIGVSFPGVSSIQEFKVRCQTPQEAVDSVCSGFLEKGYYFPRDYRIEFCHTDHPFAWSVSDCFQVRNIGNVDFD